MRRIAAIFLLAPALLFAQQKPATTIQLAPTPLLPMSFAGWTATAAPVESTTPPSAAAALLNECGFKRTATATYVNARKTITATATQFADATGAYSYFPALPNGDSTHPSIAKPSICAGLCPTFLLSGNTVVIVPLAFDADLFALAKTLPVPSGGSGVPPSLPGYLPKHNLDVPSVRFAEGPAGFALTHSPLVGHIDFNTGAEAVVGHYGSGTLTLVEYPTPQMAAAELRSIADALHLSAQSDGSYTGDKMAALRTGPIIAAASGLPVPQALKLAAEVHYEATLTWNHPEGYVSEAWKAAHLYLGIAALSGILISAAVLLGLFLGGGRALYRVMRGKPASSVMDTEFLHLDLGHGGDYVPHHDTAAMPPPPPKQPN